MLGDLTANYNGIPRSYYRFEPRAIDNNKAPLPQRMILPGANSTDSLLLMFRLLKK
jgi:hypothetical protein